MNEEKKEEIKEKKRDLTLCKKCGKMIKKSQILKFYESEKIRVRCDCGTENFYYLEWDKKEVKNDE